MKRRPFALGSSPEEDISDVLPTDGIESAHGLVEHENLGFVHYRGCERETLQHSLRQGLRAAIHRLSKPHALEDGSDAVSERRCSTPESRAVSAMNSRGVR